VTRAEIEKHLRQSRWPNPSPDLRARVLAAAPRVVGAVTWSDRVWFSRGWRIAAAAVVVGVIAIDLMWPAMATGAGIAGPQALADAQVVDDVGRDIGLPSALTAALAQQALAVDARRLAANREQTDLQTLETEGNRR